MKKFIKTGVLGGSLGAVEGVDEELVAGVGMDKKKIGFPRKKTGEKVGAKTVKEFLHERSTLGASEERNSVFHRDMRNHWPGTC